MPTLRVVPGDEPAVPPERRRSGWTEFRRAYPGVVAVCVVAIVALLVMDGFLVARRARYAAEIARLRAGMTAAERARADAAESHEANRFALMVALVRRQAGTDATPHLSIAVDSGAMYFERDGAVLREALVRVGPEKTVGAAPDTVRMAVPRGARTVEAVLGPHDGWLVPAWVYHDRGLEVPNDRTIAGALGPAAIVLSGGTVIYSMPTAGPLNDSSYVLPGSVRASAADLAAIAPNLRPGMTVYLY